MGASRSRVKNPEEEIRKVFREAGYTDGWTNAVIEDLGAEDRERLDWLAALEAAGVDNWEGYDVAIQILNGEDIY